MDIRQASTGGAGLELGQTILGSIKSIQAPAGAHQGAYRQRLAPCPGAKIDHHFAAPWLQQLAKQLRTFVLHLNATIKKKRVLLQGRFAAKTYSDG